MGSSEIVAIPDSDPRAQRVAELRRHGTYRRLFALGESLRTGLVAVLKEEGVAAQVQGDGPLAAVVFTDREVVDYRTAFDSDRTRARTFLLGLFRRGKLYLSLAHTDADIQRLLAIARATLRDDCR